MDGVSRVMARIAEIESRFSNIGAADFRAALAGSSSAYGTATLAPGMTYGGVGEAVVADASRFLGVPYLYGGAGPRAFDCSGLVQYVFREFGVELSHYTVTQAEKGTPVARAGLRPGDVIFFGENGGTGFLYHVGIYVGNNSFIHAPHTGDVVKISKLEGKYDTNYACARRYL